MRTGKRIGILLLALVLILGAATGCTQTNGEQTESTPSSQEAISEYTLLIYMCGSDLETKSAAATKNIRELLSARLPEGVNIVLQTGGTRKWRDYGISSTALGRYTIENGALKLEESLPNASMGDPETLEAFLRWGAQRYPARKMGLILWDHGGGSIAGISFDENFQYDGLTLGELDQALSASREVLSGKWDFIGFDACLMANYETASVVAPYAHRMVASEENEPAGGWDYQVLAENLGGDSFYSRLLAGYAEKCRSGGKETFTLSVLDLDGFSRIQAAFASSAASLDDMDLAEIAKAAAASISFGSGSHGSYSNLIDLGCFGELLGFRELTEAIGEYTQVENGTYHQGAAGLSFFYPLRDMLTVKDYLPLAEESYRSFLEKHYTVTDGDWIEVTGAEEQNGMLSVTVSPESVSHIVESTYQLFWFETEGEREWVYGMGEDTDIVFDGENRYTVNFQGNWITFGDQYIHADVREDREAYTVFTSPMYVNGIQSEMRFVYDKATRTIQLQGYVPQGDAVGRIMDFAVGDQITLLYDDRNEYKENLKPGESFVYSEDTSLHVATLPEGYYQYTLWFYDIYGKPYQAATAVIFFDGSQVEIVTVTQDRFWTD